MIEPGEDFTEFKMKLFKNKKELFQTCSLLSHTVAVFL